MIGKDQTLADQELAAEKRERRGKRKRKATWVSYAILAMALIHFFDILQLDSLIYFFVGGFDSVAGTVFLPSVKAGMGTAKVIGFSCAGAFAFFASKQEV